MNYFTRALQVIVFLLVVYLLGFGSAWLFTNLNEKNLVALWFFSIFMAGVIVFIITGDGERSFGAAFLSGIASLGLFMLGLVINLIVTFIIGNLLPPGFRD